MFNHSNRSCLAISTIHVWHGEFGVMFLHRCLEMYVWGKKWICCDRTRNRMWEIRVCTKTFLNYLSKPRILDRFALVETYRSKWHLCSCCILRIVRATMLGNITGWLTSRHDGLTAFDGIGQSVHAMLLDACRSTAVERFKGIRANEGRRAKVRRSTTLCRRDEMIRHGLWAETRHSLGVGLVLVWDRSVVRKEANARMTWNSWVEWNQAERRN